MSRLSVLAIVAVIITIGLIGGSGSVRADSPSQEVVFGGTSGQVDLNNSSLQKGNQTDGLAPVLIELIDAESRSEFASSHNLEVSNGSVLVVIELSSGETVPAGYDVQVESRYSDGQTLIQGYVRIGELRSLASESTVSYVRPPNEGFPDQSQQTAGFDGKTDADSTASTGSSSSLVLALGAVLALALAATALIYRKQ